MNLSKTSLLGQGSTLSALSAQAAPAFASLLAGAARQDKPDEAQPRPNSRHYAERVKYLMMNMDF
jgi:hypothetical protein